MLKHFLSKLSPTTISQSKQFSRSLSEQYRTHYCNELSLKDIGKNVQICGWVQSTRFNKFLILRDFYDILQVYIPDDLVDRMRVNDLNLESVIKITGTVRSRPRGQENVKLNTGTIEIECSRIDVINNACSNLPLQLNEQQSRSNENIRLKYRYLDLRNKLLQANIKQRSDFMHSVRNFLSKNKFLDIETPTLFRRTPGGAREFLVPTRIEKKFFSLTQSPQQFKQLLMIGGFDRYYQIARCYRDEELKADRQPEFTQIDLEMSFVDESDIIHLVESLLHECWPLDKLKTPFRRITYAQAMGMYGTDKPDLRFDLKFTNLNELFRKAHSGITVIDTQADDIYAYGLKIPQTLFADTTKFNIDKIEKLLKAILKETQLTTKLTCIMTMNKTNGNHLNKYLSNTFKTRLYDTLEVGSDELLIVLTSQHEQKLLETFGKFRLAIADYIDAENVKVSGNNKPLLRDPNRYEFEWVVDFPLFTYDETKGRFESTHHPFTAPKDDHLQYLYDNTKLDKIIGKHYDLVLNGNEIAGGSIRVHNAKIQRHIIETVLKEDFKTLEHLIEALDNGAPPHGGIALGLDRLMAIICKATSIRDVIAFPKSSSGRDLMSDSPSNVTQDELDFYKIKLVD